MDDLGTVGTAVADAGAVETPEITTTAVETPEPATTEITELPEGTPPETPEVAEPEGDLGGEEEAEPSSTGASAAELKIRKDIAELKKTNPEAAKQWAKEHYSLGAFQKEFPTVQEARTAKATIESLGGQDGINELQDEVTDFRNEIAQFRDGDVKLLEDLYTQNPNATVVNAQNLMNLLMEKNGEHFDQAIIPSMYARLDGGGVYKAMARIGNTLNVVQQAVEEGDGQKAYDILKQLRNPEVMDSFAQMEAWFGHMKSLAQKNGDKQNKRVDPEREAFDRERQEFAETKAKENDQRIGQGVTKLNNTSMSKIADSFFKEIKLGPEGRSRFLKNLESEIYDAMKKDKTYQRLASSKKAKGDNEATIRFMNAKFAELLPDKFRSVRNALYPNWKPGKVIQKPNGTPATGNGSNGARPAVAAAPGTVGAKPAHNDVDWDKTDQLNWISGKGIVLKNGKTVNVDWRAVRV